MLRYLGIVVLVAVSLFDAPTQGAVVPSGAPDSVSANNAVVGQEAPVYLDPQEFYRVQRLAIEQELQDDILLWAKHQFWWIAAIIAGLGFFGVRAFVQDLISREIREATRAAAAASAVADQSREMNRTVRAEADANREQIEDIGRRARAMDEQLARTAARLDAESKHGIAQTVLDIQHLAAKFDGLNELVAALAARVDQDQQPLADYKASMDELEGKSAAERMRFQQRGHYSIQICADYSREAKRLANEVQRHLTQAGFKAAVFEGAMSRSTEPVFELEFTKEEGDVADEISDLLGLFMLQGRRLRLHPDGKATYRPGTMKLYISSGIGSE